MNKILFLLLSGFMFLEGSWIDEHVVKGVEYNTNYIYRNGLRPYHDNLRESFHDFNIKLSTIYTEIEKHIKFSSKKSIYTTHEKKFDEGFMESIIKLENEIFKKYVDLNASFEILTIKYNLFTYHYSRVKGSKKIVSSNEEYTFISYKDLYKNFKDLDLMGPPQRQMKIIEERFKSVIKKLGQEKASMN